MYGVDGGADGAWDEGDPVMWATSEEADAAWAKASEGVGAVYDQDEAYEEFCACVTCEDEDDFVSDISRASTCACVACGVEEEYVCGIDAESDDDRVGAEYRGLRDVDGWQRKDPWGGSAGDAPRRPDEVSTRGTLRNTYSSTSTLTSPTRILSSTIRTSSSTGLSETESGKAPPSTDEPGRGETQKSILDMSESEIIELEDRARQKGGTGESPFAHRFPFS